MAIIPIGTLYPNPMKWQDRIRNGKVPDDRAVANAIYSHFFALAHCRKLFFHKIVQPGATPQSVSGTTTPWRWVCRTGEGTQPGNANTMWIEAIVLPSSSTLGTDPRWRVFAGANYSDYQHFPLEDAAPTFDQITHQWTQITGLAPNTEYECGLEVVDYGRVLGLDCWEWVQDGLDTAAPYVTDYRTIGNEHDITDAQHTDGVVTDPFTIWKHNGGHVFNLVPDDASNPWQTASATYVNLLDATASTTVSASTPGMNAVVQYHNPTHTNDVNAIFAAYGQSLAARGTDSVILADSGGTLGTLTGFNSSGEWKSVAVALDGSLARHKVDVQFRDTATDKFTVSAVSLYEYEP